MQSIAPDDHSARRIRPRILAPTDGPLQHGPEVPGAGRARAAAGKILFGGDGPLVERFKIRLIKS
jgi:hypothetical protein